MVCVRLERATQDRKPGKRHYTSCRLHYAMAVASTSRCGKRPKPDSNAMKQGCREDETRSIGETRGEFRNLSSVCMAVEDREEPYHSRGRNDPNIEPERDDRPENHNGKGDCKFDERKRGSCAAEHAANAQHADKSQREEPERSTPQVACEKSNGDHGKDVIKAADGVHEAMSEPAGAANVRMSANRRREKRKPDGTKISR